MAILTNTKPENVSVALTPTTLRLEQGPLGSGVIEFDPHSLEAEATVEAGSIERGVSTIAFCGLVAAAVYLLYLFVSQLFEPFVYVITHLV